MKKNTLEKSKGILISCILFILFSYFLGMIKEEHEKILYGENLNVQIEYEAKETYL